MSRTQYVKNTSEVTVDFPTLDPPLSIRPGEIVGLPGEISALPYGLEPAKAGDWKPLPGDEDTKPQVAVLAPETPAEPVIDRWYGEPAILIDPAPADTAPAPDPAQPTSTPTQEG